MRLQLIGGPRNGDTHIAIRPRGEKVTIELTAKQADVLWMLLEGSMCRNEFQRRTMRTLSQIGKRVSDACGFNWHW